MALSKAAEEETALVGIESAPLAADAEEAEPTEEAEKKPTEEVQKKPTKEAVERTLKKPTKEAVQKKPTKEAEKIRWRIEEAEKIRWRIESAPLAADAEEAEPTEEAEEIPRWRLIQHWDSPMGRRERTGFFGRYPAQVTGFFSEFASTDGLREVARLLACWATKAPAVSVITSCDGREEGMKLARHDLLPTMPALLPRSSRGWLNSSSSTSIFSCTDPGPIPVGEPLDVQQLTRHEEERLRAMKPGHFKKLTMDGRLVMDCLRHYNSMHLGDEYESAPGKVTRHCHMRDGICWTHGNFMARRKRSGFFSFLPAPRTLFFFELAFKDGFDQVVTCTPLSDEPVTEAYSVLGFPLWWSTRRNGRLDCICKTCNRRLEVLHPDLKRTFACGHKEVERVCEMCYHCSDVLHPSPGEFAFGGEMFPGEFAFGGEIAVSSGHKEENTATATEQ